MAPAASERLLAARAEETGEADIHEHDRAYLHRCYDAYREAARRYGWRRVCCSDGEAPRPPHAIAADVYAAVRAALGESAASLQRSGHD